MARDRKGARRLMALFYRVDGEVTRLAIGTAEPCCDGAHIARLFAEKLDQVAQDFDAGYGFDALGLSASVAEDMTPIQAMMQEVAGREGARKGANGVSPPEDSYKIPSDLSFLMDRLGNRLGPSHVTQFRAFESHIPERAVRSVPVMAIHAGGGVGWDEVPSSRPLAMLACAEPIDVVAEVPEGPPRIFRWRKVSYRVAQIEGPERLAPEWWRQTDVTGMSGKTRDYFRVEDEQGHRFWLYRDGLYDRETSKPRWYVHGVFG
jgi:protein ImuB